MKLMQDLLEKQLQNLYNSEELILKVLPEMMHNATNKKLKKIIQTQITDTKTQKIRLEELSQYLKMKIINDDGKVIRGLVEDIRDLFADFPDGLLMDAGLISKLLHIQHFQISAYETGVLYAEALELKGVSKKLALTLDEAHEADEECSRFAKELILNKNRM